ncbi:hypothetical protein FOMPIDRAFT_1032068 [Fomitopsis schrenkii]|uniref:Small secreted protein n=1 Tax=Fomitopsis schrenkii TaxID=2126942 RepID=S8FFL9_FOMSC|nr:hypothetical protein FOMPIDRAFT_1032068 [Fomitopsis schrenkii]
MARLSLLALIASAVAFIGVQAAPLPHEVRGVYVRHKTATATASASAASATATSSSSSSSNTTSAAAGTFQQLDYSQFQISDGTGGNAEAQANAVFVDPFTNVDLATIDAATVTALQTMREAAEDAETSQFNPAIAAATGTAADALQVGKIKNKVLKLTGEVQVLNIQIAQAQASGDDTSDLESKLTEEQTKLTKNIATDVANNGKTSQGVA